MAATTLIGRVGNDAFGKNLVNYLRDQQVQVEVTVDSRESTGTAIIAVDGKGENQITVVPGANYALSFDDCHALNELERNDLVVVQNEIRWPLTQEVLQFAKSHQARTLLNLAPAHPLDLDVLHFVDYLIVNERECNVALGHACSASQLADVRRRLPCNVVLTLGAQGVVAAWDDATFQVAGHRVAVSDTTGAGDCFVGAFAAQITGGQTPLASLEFANRAAAISVTRPGASAAFPSPWEVDAFSFDN